METPTTTFEIRDRHGNWHPLESAFFWSQRAGKNVLMWFREDSDEGFERAALERLIDEGTVRAASVQAEYLPEHEARALINHEGRAHTLVIRFTKADGSRRRMVCRYTGTPSRSRYHMVVWDLEKGAWRQVDTRAVDSIKVVSADGSISFTSAQRRAA